MEFREELQTSEYWKTLYYSDYEIIDPDGWDRSNFVYSFYEEKISKEEFDKRFFRSTIGLSKPSFAVRLDNSIIEFLKTYGTIVHNSDETNYYFLPFWIEESKESGDYYMMHSLDNLPDKLRNLINEKRR